MAFLVVIFAFQGIIVIAATYFRCWCIARFSRLTSLTTKNKKTQDPAILGPEKHRVGGAIAPPLPNVAYGFPVLRSPHLDSKGRPGVLSHRS